MKSFPTFAFLLIIIGTFLLLTRTLGIEFFALEYLFPGILILIGLTIIISNIKKISSVRADKE